MTVYEYLVGAQSRACSISEDNCKQTFARFDRGERVAPFLSNLSLDSAIKWAKEAMVLDMVIDNLPVDIAETDIP